MNKFEKILSKYDYAFPQNLIAKSPVAPRDAAKLLIYDKKLKTIQHDIYKNIGNYLPKNSVLVLNETKVLPARVKVSKPTGGIAKLLYIKHTLGKDGKIFALSNKKLEPQSIVKINNKIFFTVLDKEQQFYILEPSFEINKIFEVLKKYGETPLPPYIKNSSLTGKKLEQEYNTVFAKNLGSVAAPTASIHFTKALLKKLTSSGISIKHITLHVGLGTFASLTEQQLKTKTLHEESFFIDKPTAKFLNQAKKSGRKIVAVGTTVVRTLESASNKNGYLENLSGSTSLFIDENYKLKFVDILATNFHVPKSSLMMLASAFISRKQLLSIYKIAIANKYRLFSFGDGMLIK